MIGITSYGAYIPFFRLSRQRIGEAWGVPTMPGERSVACFDEDSLTMAVDAGRDCIRGFGPDNIGALYLATTTPPYHEKLAAGIASAALDLSDQVRTVDFSHSLRAGTMALNAALDTVKAGAADKVLILAADCRLGIPASQLEQLLGDGAAALTVGSSGVIANIECSYSLSSDLFDLWRTPQDPFVRSWEDRWAVDRGYNRLMQAAISGLLKRSGLAPTDFTKVVVYARDARSHTSLLNSLGFDPKAQLQDPLLTSIGHSGTAHVLMTLVSALETAGPGERILLANYQDGSDAFVLRITEEIEKVRDRRGIKGHLEAKSLMASYQQYLQWRQLLPVEAGSRRPQPQDPSPPALAREGARISGLHAQRCIQCGTIQYHEFHRMRVCFNCHAKDCFEDISLADKKGEVFTYTLDHLGSAFGLPTMYTMVDFEGGGRMLCQATNIEPSQLHIGLPVEMCYRKLYTAGGVHNYFWKSRPAG